MHIVFEDQRRAVIADRRIEVRNIAQDFAEGTDQQYYGRQLRVRMRLVPFAPPGFHLRHIDIVMMRPFRSEERRVGIACGIKCRPRWSPNTLTKNKKQDKHY